MLIRAALMASLLFLTPTMASAEITFTRAVTVTSGNPLSALEHGDVVTIDITMRSDGQLTLGVGAAASGYDTSLLTFDSGLAVTDVLVQACLPSFGCLNGLPNVAANLPLAEAIDAQDGPFVQFLTALNLTGSTFTGAADEGIVTSVAGDPQFRVIFTVPTPGEGQPDVTGTTQIDIGVFPEFGNAVVLPGGGTGVSNNTVVNLTMVPEPGEIASSLTALGSVFAVVALRRRK